MIDAKKTHIAEAFFDEELIFKQKRELALKRSRGVVDYLGELAQVEFFLRIIDQQLEEFVAGFGFEESCKHIIPIDCVSGCCLAADPRTLVLSFENSRTQS